MTVVYIRDRQVKCRLRQEIADLADELQVPRPPLGEMATFGELMHVLAGLHAERDRPA